jgi:hypothetical protein
MISTPFRRRLLLTALVALVGSAAAPIGSAPIIVRGAWTRPAAAGMNAAGYLTIVNTGPFADRLISAASPSATRVSIHESRRVGAVMTMRALPMLRIPSKSQVALAPGGYHLMLEALRRPLRLGERVPVTLNFDRAGALHVRLAVGAGPAVSGVNM